MRKVLSSAFGSNRLVCRLGVGSRRRGARLRGCPPERPSPTPPPLCRYAERPIDLIRVAVRDDQLL